jgi:hypothetical protein
LVLCGLAVRAPHRNGCEQSLVNSSSKNSPASTLRFAYGTGTGTGKVLSSAAGSVDPPEFVVLSIQPALSAAQLS